MTVGELRKALCHIANDVEVVINQGGYCMSRTTKAHFVPESPIGPDEVWIDAGEGFGY